LRVDVRGHRVTALHNGREALVAEDRTYSAGQVGLRVVNTHAVFSGFESRGQNREGVFSVCSDATS
jgi:hypothetical protein